jgi:hypothetical protein
MKQEILVKMQRGVYYPGNHLGKRKDLDNLVTDGLLERHLAEHTRTTFKPNNKFSSSFEIIQSELTNYPFRPTLVHSCPPCPLED